MMGKPNLEPGSMHDAENRDVNSREAVGCRKVLDDQGKALESCPGNGPYALVQHPIVQPAATSRIRHRRRATGPGTIGAQVGQGFHSHSCCVIIKINHLVRDDSDTVGVELLTN